MSSTWSRLRLEVINAGGPEESMDVRLLYPPQRRLAEKPVGTRAGRPLAELGNRRLPDGERQDPAALRVVYLRPPAMGPRSASL